jgi:hypothetical protein
MPWQNILLHVIGPVRMGGKTSRRNDDRTHKVQDPDQYFDFFKGWSARGVATGSGSQSSQLKSLLNVHKSILSSGASVPHLTRTFGQISKLFKHAQKPCLQAK